MSEGKDLGWCTEHQAYRAETHAWCFEWRSPCGRFRIGEEMPATASAEYVAWHRSRARTELETMRKTMGQAPGFSDVEIALFSAVGAAYEREFS